MSSWRLFLARHSLNAGLVLMFALTWPIDLASSGLMPFQFPLPVYIFLGWGFIVASLTMTGLTQGRAGVVRLLRRYLIWRVGRRWYLLAFAFYPVIFITAIGLNALLTGEPVDFSQTLAVHFFGEGAPLLLLLIPFFIFESIANGEEMGWRGYVLPRLQARHSALIASLILGPIWALWHLPKFLGPESEGSFALIAVKILADAILYTWLFNSTGGSLLLVTIFHGAGNTAAFFLPMANTVSSGNFGALVISVALIVLAAVVVTIVMGSERLSRTGEKQVEPLVDGELAPAWE